MGVCTGDENDGWKLSAYLVARMPIVAAGNLVRGQRHDVHFSAASKSCIFVMQVGFSVFEILGMVVSRSRRQTMIIISLMESRT